MLKEGSCRGGATGDAPESRSGGVYPFAGSNPVPGTQTCNDCQETKPLDNYGLEQRKGREPRIRKVCKACIARKARERRARDPEKYRLITRQYQERFRNANPELVRERKAYSRRKRRLEGEFREGAHEPIAAGPFHEWLDKKLADGFSYEELCGPEVAPRSLRRAHKENVGRVSLSLVDRVLMFNDVGLWELYD